MRFTKLHGLGNSYFFVNCFYETVTNPEGLAKDLSGKQFFDKNFGAGSDGLILVMPPSDQTKADIRMRIFNADGSEAEMCGNGVRCAAKFAYDRGLSFNNPMRVETGRGVLTLDLHVKGFKVEGVTVNMGEPILKLPEIPVNADRLEPGKKDGGWVIPGLPEVVEANFVSMGNPHAVIFVPDVEAVDVKKLGPLIEKHPAFPNRINVHWAQTLSTGEVRMATWERGSGMTLACGTGACAVCVASALGGLTDRSTKAHLPGGTLLLDWKKQNNCVFMTGPATEVCDVELRA
jgi:diaminopimelate epimerase